MYICICSQITEEDLEKNPGLIEFVGIGCGRCISVGGVPDFDSEQKINGRWGVATDPNSEET